MTASGQADPPAAAANDAPDLLQLVSLVLSIYVLVALAVETVVKLTPEMSQLLDQIDFAICLFFLFDFFLRLYKAKSKLQFLKWGWIDFISSIPFPISFASSASSGFCAPFAPSRC
jgi:hypothetical protein